MPEYANILTNGLFEPPIENHAPHGWTVTGSATAVEYERSVRFDDRPALRIDCRDVGYATIAQQVKADPADTVMVRVQVRSTGRVIARLGQLSMSYNQQGQWQQLVGTARPDNNGSLSLTISISSLDGEPVSLWLADASLVKVDRPDAPQRKPRSGSTSLREGATIIYPAGDPQWRALAEQVRDAIKTQAGVDVSIITDADATLPDQPILRDVYANQHLILLGRLDVNRAMWPAYGRFLCAADGYYPGDGGYVVRTAADVMRNGHNHIIIGASNDADTAVAVDRFIEQLDGPTLPWLLDVQLGGACLDNFRGRDALWRDDPDNNLLPPVQSGYGSVRRWYENAMGYYWSGWESYRQRTIDTMRVVLDDRADTHQYLLEFMVRTHDMLDLCDDIPQSMRAEMDELILHNFWDFLLGPDLGWMTIFSRPYDSIQITNRHQIAPWYSDLVTAEYLLDHFDLPPAAADLVAFRLSEKRAFFDDMVDNRWGPSIRGPINGSQCHEEIVAVMFRYSIEHERYGFFNEGRAHRALHLDFIDHRSGALVRPSDRQDVTLLLGMLAQYHRDGRYARLAQLLPNPMHPTGPFQGRYVCGVHRYTPGSDLPSSSLDEWTGLRIPEPMPHHQRNINQLGDDTTYRKPDVTADELFNFAAFRGGFEPTDDYLAVTGIAASCAPGALLCFTSDDAQWLAGGATQSYFDQNAVHVLRTDQWTNPDKPYASAARLDRVDDNTVAFTLEPFNGTRWQRSITRVGHGSYIIRDTVTAIEPGTYQIIVNWHLNGAGQWDDTHWTAHTDKAALRITPVGRDLQLMTDAPTRRVARFAAEATLAAGESRTIESVLQSYRGPEPANNAQIDKAIAAATPVRSAAHDVQQVDAADLWQPRWTYTGLQRPSLVTATRRIGDDMIDLGRVMKLAEIRATWRRGGPYVPAKLELPIEYAVRADGPWHTIDTPPVWRPGTRTGNYGEAHPVDEDAQAIELDNLEARYLRGERVHEWMIFTSDEQSARRDIAIDAVDDALLLLRPKVWPKYIRRSSEEDDIIAVIDHDGHERFQYQAPRNLQGVTVIDHQIATVDRAGLIRMFDTAGRIAREIDLYALHVRYNDQFGHTNTRHPAGGMVMPFGIGAWRGTPGAPSPLVVARYGAVSFINSGDELEGPQMIGGYVYPYVLPQGIDFDGDGTEEQLVLGRGLLYQLHGHNEPYITEPQGHAFYPQVYQRKLLREPAWPESLDGAVPLVVEPLDDRYVVIVRDNYVGVYDGRSNAWAFSWAPLVGIRSAVVTRAGGNELAIAVLTEDALLWRMLWDGDFSKPAQAGAQTLTLDAQSMRTCGDDLLVAGHNGVHIIAPDNTPTRIIASPATDAVAMPDGSIVIAFVDGRVQRIMEAN